MVRSKIIGMVFLLNILEFKIKLATNRHMIGMIGTWYFVIPIIRVLKARKTIEKNAKNLKAF